MAWQARCCGARFVLARLGMVRQAWRGAARQCSVWQVWVRFGRLGVVGHGVTCSGRHGRHGVARRGIARHGKAGGVRRGQVWLGVARKGWARHGRLGEAWLGQVRSGRSRSGTAGSVWSGWSCSGEVGSGRLGRRETSRAAQAQRAARFHAHSCAANRPPTAHTAAQHSSGTGNPTHPHVAAVTPTAIQPDAQNGHETRSASH